MGAKKKERARPPGRHVFPGAGEAHWINGLDGLWAPLEV